MLVDIEEFLTDNVVGLLFAVLFVATLVTGLLAWTPERAERFLVRRRLPVADKTVMAVQVPLTRYRWTLLAVLLPAVFGAPYLTGAAYVVPLLVDRAVRPTRIGGVEPTPPYGVTRALLEIVGGVVLVALVGAGFLVAAVRGHASTVAAWYVALAVAGVVISQVAARLRYPSPEPSDVPMAIVATVDRRIRWAAVGGGLFLALIGAGRAAASGADALAAEWGWQGTTIEALDLASTAATVVAVAVLIVAAFVVPLLDSGRS